MGLLLTNSQSQLVRIVGNGEQDIEFKYLADWYRDHARPGERMVCLDTCYLKMFVPQSRSDFLSISSLQAKSPADFLLQCREKDVTYVAWDSRTAHYINPHYYKLSGLENIAMLAEPASVGSYEFVTRIINPADPRRLVNVFRILSPEK